MTDLTPEERRARAAAHMREWRAKNREAHLATRRQHRAENRDRLNAVERKRRQELPPEAKAATAAYMKTWEAEHREDRNAYQMERYYENPEIREQNQKRAEAWAKENPKARKEHKARYRDGNRDQLREASYRYIRDENGQINAKEKAHQTRNRSQRAITHNELASRPRPEICEICGGPPDATRGMHFDHCHDTFAKAVADGIDTNTAKRRAFRGWLCRGCNLMLGNAKDDPKILELGAAFLRCFASIVDTGVSTD